MTGFDGFLYSIGCLVAWWRCCWSQVLRNTGKFTMADVLALDAARSRADGRGDLDARGIAVLPAGPDAAGPVAWSACLLMGISGNMGSPSPSRWSASR